jgi:hypothetical protein
MSGYSGVDGETHFAQSVVISVGMSEAGDPNLAVHLIVDVIMNNRSTAVSL